MQTPLRCYFGIWAFYHPSLGLNSPLRHRKSRHRGTWRCLLCVSVRVGGHNFAFLFTEPLIKLLQLNIKSNCIKIALSIQEVRIRACIRVNGSCTWMVFNALSMSQIPKDAADIHKTNILCKYSSTMSQFLCGFPAIFFFRQVTWSEMEELHKWQFLINSEQLRTTKFPTCN